MMNEVFTFNSYSDSSILKLDSGKLKSVKLKVVGS